MNTVRSEPNVAWAAIEMIKSGIDADLRKTGPLVFEDLPAGPYTTDVVRIKSKALRDMKQVDRKVRSND